MDRVTKEELIKKAEIVRMTTGAEVVITGMWIWVRFEDKPSPEIRRQLKEEGFKWSKNKEKWYFAGKITFNKKAMDWEYIRARYGEEEVK